MSAADSGLLIRLDGLRSGAAGDTGRRTTLALSPRRPLLLLGTNGAGKTSLLRLIANIGYGTVECVIAGESRSIAVSASLDFLGFDPAYRVREAAKECALSLGWDRDSYGRFKQLSHDFGIVDHASRRLGELSLGNRQRVRLALAMTCKADLLLLDEPFRALDVSGCKRLAALLNRRAHGSRFVLLSSHQDVADLDRDVLDLDGSWEFS